MKHAAHHRSHRTPALSSVSQLLVHPIVLIVMAIASGATAAVGVTFIRAQSTVLYGCYKNEIGNLRIVKEGDKCQNNETAINWNVQGPAGPPGIVTQVGGSSYPFTCPKCTLDNRVGNRLQGKDLGNAVLYEAQFGNVNLSDTSLKNAVLKNAKFDGTTLEHTNFSNADLSGVTFANVSLKGASFTDADISGVNWQNSTCPDSSNSDRNGNTCVGHF